MISSNLPTKPGEYGWISYQQCECCVEGFGLMFVFNDPKKKYRGLKYHHIGDLCYCWEAGDVPMIVDGMPCVDKVFSTEFLYEDYRASV
jgi:hypothetical protein